jgi:hypothetical protein
MDLFILLPLDQLKDRYSKHYMRGHQATNEIETAAIV